MNYIVTCPDKHIKGEITLPTSKSISNRLLIIKALANHRFAINNLSESDDTRVMMDAFTNEQDTVNIGHAGTSMRFLTAYFAATAQKKIMTGSQRMKERPIRELVESLNQLGADITYLENTGFPPIQTSGNPLKGNEITINGSISSQYITALLLVAPSLPNGLIIRISGKLISESYVKMTLQLMQQYGVEADWQNNIISIKPQTYQGEDSSVEADWSGASYWYQIAALSNQADIIAHGLTANSCQGDAAVAILFEKLGIKTTYGNNFVRITKQPCPQNFFEADFINNPDLVQTFVVTLCLMDIKFRITGADTLRIKETDRITALQNEMKKLGYIIRETSTGVLEWDGEKEPPVQHIAIDTYKDHRMALSFAPAVLKFPKIIINDTMVVTKSYPRYWDDLQLAGFTVVPE